MEFMQLFFLILEGIVPQNLPSHFLKKPPWILRFASNPIPSFELQIFHEDHSQGQNGHLHTEKSNFDFWIKIKSQKIIFHQDMLEYEVLFHQEIQKSNFTLEKSNSKCLEIFLSV